MSGSLATFIRSQVTSAKVVIFSKSYCPYCQSAKSMFNQLQQPFVAIELDQVGMVSLLFSCFVENGSAIQSELEKTTGQRTVPNIFINGKHVGGRDTLAALMAKNELQPLLAKDGKEEL